MAKIQAKSTHLENSGKTPDMRSSQESQVKGVTKSLRALLSATRVVSNLLDMQCRGEDAADAATFHLFEQTFCLFDTYNFLSEK